MRKAFIVTGCCFLAMQFANCEVVLPEASLTLRVVDDNGVPVAGASAGIEKGVHGKASAGGLTDANGVYIGTLRTVGSLFYGAQKDGFYSAGGEYVFRPGAMAGAAAEWKDRRWAPWNPAVEVVLKKKGVLLPMYAKRIQITQLAGPAKGIGYDCEAGDWVAPYGRGKTPDLIFSGNGEYAKGTYQLQWTFSNPGDGIRVVPPDQGARSELKSPKEAPEDGYASSMTIDAKGRVLGADGLPGERPECFLFRVRTLLDTDGKVVTAHYGKIYPEQSHIVYYLNPERNSRSLEYDPARNLLKTKERINDY